MTFHRYKVRPFDHPRFQKHALRNRYPCAICGKPVDDPWPHTAIIIDGGASWGDQWSDENDPGYMAAYPVGPECHRMHVAQTLADELAAILDINDRGVRDSELHRWLCHPDRRCEDGCDTPASADRLRIYRATDTH